MKENDTTYREEIPSGFDPMWFAGLVEVACTAGLSVGLEHRGFKTYFHVNPLIKMGDNNFDRMIRLKAHAGGNASHLNKYGRGNSPYQWAATGRYAVDLAMEVSPYAPSRAETFTAFLNWANTDDIEEKIVIARELHETRGGRVEVSAGDYESLVRDNAFVAGAIDARGTIRRKDIEYVSRKPYEGDDNLPPHDWIIRWLDMPSKNLSLLEALQRQWGGNIFQNMRMNSVS